MEFEHESNNFIWHSKMHTHFEDLSLHRGLIDMLKEFLGDGNQKTHKAPSI